MRPVAVSNGSGARQSICSSSLAVATRSRSAYRPQMAEQLQLTATAMASDGLASRATRRGKWYSWKVRSQARRWSPRSWLSAGTI